jgi:dihydroorotate dehydrogenase electron transfer subunit
MPVDVEARVIRNTRLSPDYNVIALAAPEIAAAAAPGQFVMVKPGRGLTPLLRRPFSVFEVLRAGGRIEGLTLLSKRVGVTTQMLFDAVEGDVVSCLGPLGTPYTLVDPPAEAWMVAGGVGQAPFATLTDVLRERGTNVTLLYGARTDRDLFYLDWFRDRGVRLMLATEDGSLGDHGRITKPLERELHQAAGRDVMIYACGPEPMLEAVAHAAAAHQRPCEVSVERVMGCGLGGCYSCVIPLRGGPKGHHYVRACLAGPVLSGDQVAWEAH